MDLCEVACCRKKNIQKIDFTVKKIESEFREFYAGITLKNVIIYSSFTSSQIIASPKGHT